MTAVIIFSVYAISCYFIILAAEKKGYCTVLYSGIDRSEICEDFLRFRGRCRRSYIKIVRYLTYQNIPDTAPDYIGSVAAALYAVENKTDVIR